MSANLSFQMANCIRSLTIDAIEQAQSGHPGMPLGMADVATVLCKNFLKINPTDPEWFNRDRLILSAGHGSMLLYSIAYLLGYKSMSIEDLKKFRQFKSITPGHPEHNIKIGIETTTGPLGQGLANAVGMALAESILNAKHGDNLVDHHTYAIVGDGCLMEGISQESISFAGHHKLGKLIVLFDDNNITIDGSTDLTTSENVIKRFQACNWQTIDINGHNHEEIYNAINIAKENSEQPTLIACKTIIGYGSPNKEGSASIHGSPLGATEAILAKKTLNIPNKAFEVPNNLLQEWRNVYKQHLTHYNEWQEHYHNSNDEFKTFLQKDLPKNWRNNLKKLATHYLTTKPNKATRQLSGQILDTLVPNITQLIGGSADLSGSNNTFTSHSIAITPDNKNGNYINYGVREHFMVAAMNGLSLHSGFIPYAGTFLVFSDYCKPAIRLAALMNQGAIYVMTHDSIGLGEDGPTHQPIEHLTSLRAIPNLNVFRPADAIEAIECWELALQNRSTPSILSLTRQSVPTIRKQYDVNHNRCAMGAYIIKNGINNTPLDTCIIATGSELEIALQAHDLLLKNNINSRIISMPCMEIFNKQSQNYIEQTIPSNITTFAIEAGSSFGWEKYTKSTNNIFAIDNFGISAPHTNIYEYFNLTADIISDKIINILRNPHENKISH